MSDSTTVTPQTVYKSRKHILDMLRTQGYNTDQYSGASIHEVHCMFTSKEPLLDMSLVQDGSGKKCYIKYHLHKRIGQNNIYEYIEELFLVDNILKKEDDLIIIVKDEPNEPLQKALRNIWKQEGFFITVISLSRLQFNILEHELVPSHRLLTPSEAEEVKKKYNISKNSEVPDISRFSPVAQIIGLRPGDLCEVKRPSKTGIYTLFYRICSP